MRKALVVVGVVLVLLAIGGTALYYAADDLIARRLRPATIELLSKRFDSEVELTDMHVEFVPTLRVRGGGLSLRHRGRRDIPPLVVIRAFTIESSIRQLWAREIQRVHVEGLEIMIPPRRGEDMPTMDSSGDGGDPDVTIHELLTEDGMVTIMPKREGKRPRVFQLRRLRFEGFRFAAPVPFEAAITNPTPVGEIATVGRFGPWQREEPSLTPVDGTFLFDADLGTIKGIGGQLHAEGTFNGPLEYIRTSGRTRTKDFHLSTGGAKFPLLVDYDAIVDGTNGDTRLEKVTADLNGSHIAANGAIIDVPGVKGRRISLAMSVSDGRLEDFVKLTTRIENSPMTGTVAVTATLDIPPGEAEVIERMDLDGSFRVARAQFTTDSVQNRVDELSRRGMGRPTDRTIDDVASNLQGSFRLHNARMDVRSLQFQVQGADVRLAGHYGVKSERLDFKGTLRLRAKISQTQTGWRAFVLKIFDPLFDAKDAGTLLPITITGTRSQPSFKADIKKAILRD